MRDELPEPPLIPLELSASDLPLLEVVTHSVVVNPDDRLRSRAAEAGWPVIDLR